MFSYILKWDRQQVRRIFVLLLTAPLFLYCVQVAAENDKNSLQHIDIVLSSNKNQYFDISNNIKLNARKNYFSFRVLNIDDFEDDKSPRVLILAVGMRASAMLAKKKPHTPVISVYIPQYAYQSLLEKYSSYTRTYFVGAVFIDQPLHRQLRLAHLLVPDANKMGMILGPVSSQTISNNKELINHESMYVSKLKVLGGVIDLPSLQTLMRDNDVILTLPDPTVHQPINAKRILYNAYRAKKPIIAFSKSYVDAGALASIYSTPDQIGRQAAEKLNSYFLSTDSQRENYETAAYFEISLNPNVAWSLDIRLPDVEQLHDKIMKMDEDDE